MIAAMRTIALLLLAAAAPANASDPASPAVQQPLASPAASWNPAADYITLGQDEAGYRDWYKVAPWHASAVRSFNDYLVSNGVGGVLPTWQLLRTATSWHRCNGQPFEVPPTEQWPHIVQTLRYIHHFVVPAVGPVEAVSGYRNPMLNVCAGGAPESAHKHYSAIDLVPLHPTTKEDLMRRLCAVHGQRGDQYSVGLGFYAFLRFHIDTTRYRRWGSDPGSGDCPPILTPSDMTSVAQPVPEPTITPAMPAAPLSGPVPMTTAAPTDMVQRH